MFEQRDPITYRSFDDVPFTWVETREGLEEMINKLRQAQEIAVDLEHHSYRSFQGFLCLMQISSREEDFIVDVLKLRDELEELNEIFTNPKILKVRSPPLRVKKVLTSTRSFMGRKVISSGFNKISISMWLIYLTRTTPLSYWVR